MSVWVCVCVLFCDVVFRVLCSFLIISLMKIWQIDLLIVYIKARVLIKRVGERR